MTGELQIGHRRVNTDPFFLRAGELCLSITEAFRAHKRASLACQDHLISKRALIAGFPANVIVATALVPAGTLNTPMASSPF